MRTLLIGPYTDGELPDDVTVDFEPEVVDYANYVVSVEVSKLAGETWEAVTFNGTSGWSVQAQGIAYIRFGDGDLEADDPYTVYELQVWAHHATVVERKKATLRIRYYVYPATGAGAPT